LDRYRKLIPEISTVLMFIGSAVFALWISLSLKSISPGIQASSGTSGFGYIFVYLIVAIAASAIIILAHRAGIARIFRYVFLAITAYVVFFVFSIAASYIAVNYPEYYAITFGAPVVMVLSLIFVNNWIVIDSAGFLLTAGVASIWGLIIGAWTTVAFLAIFAIYDYIAVYKTKHMIGLAKAAVEANLPMLFVFPARRGVSLNDVKLARRDKAEEPGEMLVLGFGDLMFPCIMVVSSALFLNGPLYLTAGLPALGSVIGILVLLFGIRGRPAPGLPAINTGAILGFLAAYAVVALG